MRFQDKVVVVTGANRGIGRATVERFVSYLKARKYWRWIGKCPISPIFRCGISQLT